MVNRAVVDPNLEAAWKRLLDVYQGILDFETAFDGFLLPTAAAAGKYNATDNAGGIDYQAKIKAASLDELASQHAAWNSTGPFDGASLTTPPGGTYYHAGFTSFKGIGLITGVNLGYHPDFRVLWRHPTAGDEPDPQIGDVMWSQKEGTKNSKHPPPAATPNRSLLQVRTFYDNEQHRGKAGQGAPLSFISPDILQYLVDKGAKVAAQGSPQNNYLTLAAQLYRLIASGYVRAQEPRLGDWEAKKAVAVEALGTTADILESGNVKTGMIADLSTTNLATYDQRAVDIWPENSTEMVRMGLSSDAIIGIPGINSSITTYFTGIFSGFAEGSTGYYTNWATPGNIINKIDKLIRELILKDFPLTDAELEARSEVRFNDILHFFGVAPPGHDAATGEVQVGGTGANTAVVAALRPPKRNLTPIDLQCYLLEQIRKISSQHVSDYKNIVKLTTGGVPGLVKSQLSQRYTSEEAEALLTLCPNVQAMLVPYLKLWRVDYDKNGKATGEVELDIPNFINTEDISNILKRGRLPGAGIKSFTWNLDGVQPAEVDNNISATLEMYFQSVSDFFRNDKKAGTPGYASYLDLVIASPTGSDPENADADAAATADATAGDPKVPPPVECSDTAINNRAREYKGQSYRIKIVAGWADPGVGVLKTVRAKKATTLQRAIAKSKITLFLQQTRHQFKFNENGSLNLTVEYQAALSGMTLSPSADILTPSGNGYIDSIKNKEKAIKEYKETHKDAETDETKEAYKEMLEELKKFRAEDRLIKYKKFLKKLFESDKIYNMAVNPSEMLLPSYADLTPEGRAKRAKRRKNLNPMTFTAGGQRASNQVLLDAVTRAAEGGGDSETAAESATEALIKTYEQAENSPVIWISYFYLGDLLDLVLEQIKENTERDSVPFSFFLSEVEMIDPLSALQIKDLAEIIKCGQDLKDAAFLAKLVEVDDNTFTKQAGIHELMNIGDIPISIDAFQVWFKNYVVKKDREKYYFLHFVKDICAELITKALSSKCFGPDIKFVQRFDAQPVSYEATAEFGPNSDIRAASGDNSTTAGLSLSQAVRKLDHTTAPKDAQLGLVLLGTDSKPKGLSGKYGDASKPQEGGDIHKGVYHNYLGAPCGLLKTVNFNREDQPYLREAKIQREGSFSSAQLRELYSAEMEMYGNILYKNGSYVYINPSFIGADPDKLNILGLHGYYLITGVNSTVTENSFNVSVKALHEGISFNQPLMINPATLVAGQEEWIGLSPENAPQGWKGPAKGLETNERDVHAPSTAGPEEAKARALRAKDLKELKAKHAAAAATSTKGDDFDLADAMDREGVLWNERIAAGKAADEAAAEAAANPPTTPETPTPPEAAE